MIKIQLRYFCLSFILQERNSTTAKTLVNKALNKPTIQSGTLIYPNLNDVWSSEHAVDGKKDCPSTDSSKDFSGTAEQELPWWQVDLGKVFIIDHVIVYGRPKSWTLQFQGFRLYISTENETDSNDIVYENTDGINGEIIVNINTQNKEGRFVKIDLPKSQYNERRNNGTLVLCEVEIFAPEIARFAHVNVSSVLEYVGFNYNQENVKDNKTTTSNIDTCGCCWASKDEQNPYLQLTLPTSRSVDSVIIIGRSDGKGTDDSMTLTGIVVLTDDRPVDPNLIHSDVTSNTATIQLQSIDTKIIQVSRPKTGTQNNWFLIICEIYIYIDVTKCPTGSFGYFCEMCGNCLESSCDSETGRCISGCHPGYMNEFCNETCTPHHYGNCSQRCGHCRDNSDCNYINGSCPNGCAPGYKPEDTLCIDECDMGYFGENCVNFCSHHCTNGPSRCDKVTGACLDRCEPGFMKFNCTTQCEGGRYGQNCNESCGYCISNQPCNKYNGSCPNGCEPGFEGDLCKSACNDGKYGYSCKEFCHCKNDTACNKTNGQCSSGCDAMWTGENCSKTINLLLQIYDKIHLKMSSTYNETWTADLAVDGNTGPDPDTCHCCSRTKNSEMSWWRVDLRNLHPLKYVTIHARQEGSGIIDQLGGFSLHLTNVTRTRDITFYTDEDDVPKNLYRIHLNNTLARYLTIQRPGVLTICEVVLIEGECADGFFGDNCSSQCNCSVNKQCNRWTGQCTEPYCKLGWMGSACNIKCRPGTFGEGCGGQCFCAIGDVCSHDYGLCPGNCMEGYQGPQCNLKSDKSKTGNRTENATESSSLSIIIGASIGSSAVVIASAVVIMVILYKRFKDKDKNKDIYTQPNFNLHSSDNSDYDTLEGSNDGYVNSIASM